MANELILLFSKPNNLRGGNRNVDSELAWGRYVTVHRFAVHVLADDPNIQKAHPQLASFLFIAMEDAWPLCYIPIPDYKNV